MSGTRIRFTMQDAEEHPLILAATQRGLLEIKGDRITYNFLSLYSSINSYIIEGEKRSTAR